MTSTFGLFRLAVTIKERRIPISNLFVDVNTCALHGVKLVQQCKCGRRIELINKPNSLVCKRESCRTNYSNLYYLQSNLILKSHTYIESIINSLLSDKFKLINEGHISLEDLISNIRILGIMKNKAIEFIRSYFDFDLVFNENIDYEEKSIIGEFDLVSLINEYSSSL